MKIEDVEKQIDKAISEKIRAVGLTDELLLVYYAVSGTEQDILEKESLWKELSNEEKDQYPDPHVQYLYRLHLLAYESFWNIFEKVRKHGWGLIDGANNPSRQEMLDKLMAGLNKNTEA